MWNWTFLEQLVQDLRYALRAMGNSRAFTALAVLSLALGIGANTAIFTLVNTILLQPLPYPHADRMVWVSEFLPHLHGEVALGPDYVVWRDHARSFDQVAAYDSEDFNLSGAGNIHIITG